MGTRELLLTILIAWVGAGCQKGRESNVQPHPVVFAHSDELRKGEGFALLADRRIFAVMALLNATGFDEEASGVPMHPVRRQVRKQVVVNLAGSPGLLQKWRDYVKSRGLASFHYLDFALSLEADYPFQRIRPDQELGYRVTADRLRDFPDVLRDFWLAAGLTNVWSAVRSEYLVELNKYDLQAMQRQMAFLWEYLRMPRQDTLIVVNIPNLLDAHYHAIGARYENYYYCVQSPGSHSYGLDFHEYLHSVVNPLVQAHFQQAKDKLLRYYYAGKGGPKSKSYQDPVTFTYECLVRALDHRLRSKWSGDPAVAQRIEEQVAETTVAGLTLTRPFYELLSEYEGSGMSFDAFVPVMFAHLADCSR